MGRAFWYEVRLTGFESHAGTTPMNRRKDALVAAARVISLVHEIGEKYAPRGSARAADRVFSEFTQRHSGAVVLDLGVPQSRCGETCGNGRGVSGAR
jgi:acetylornithine deacetylase/succinyl-diaminopimelate desuccinylase-like protein